MITSLILSVTFLVLAAVFSAVADTLADHFETSIFKWKDPRWWKKDVSWQHVGFIRFTKYRPDAWHLSKSAMIVCFILFGLLFPFSMHGFWVAVISLVILGGVFNLTFNIFYNHLLRRK
jgi:uncharacterized membrane protein YccC